MACTRLGWRVFPLAATTGTPAIRNWPERATTDREKINEWWGWSFMGAGVGIATGAESGFWALDLDVKNGLNGPASLMKLQGEHGELPGTWTVRTRSGGLHLYWSWPVSGVVRNSVGEGGRGVAPGIDVRGEGGYVRAPARAADVLVAVRPTPAPAWLLQRALEAAGPRSSTGGRRVGSGAWTGSRPDPLETLRRAEDRLASVSEGGRNDALNRTAFLLARWSHETGVDRDGAWDACASACRRNGVWDDDGPEACAATFASGWNAGAAVTA